MAKLYIGCSGFSYRHWRGNFYPDDIPQKAWFSHYRRHFSTVELNVTFYRTPTAETFRRWYEETEPGFAFAVKGSRFITHIKGLNEVEVPLERFFAPARELGEKLRVVLWQFAPQFGCDVERLDRFLGLLEQYGTRHTLEFRNQGWLRDDVVELCRKRKVSLCMADWPPFVNDLPVTSGFVYLRRHGMRGSYNGFYEKAELEKDAARIRKYLEKGLDVFVYFNNDAGGAAPVNAQDLARMLDEG